MGLIDHTAALIAELRRHSIDVSPDEVPGIVHSGIDNLLDRRGIELSPEEVTTLHLITYELRKDYESTRQKVY